MAKKAIEQEIIEEKVLPVFKKKNRELLYQEELKYDALNLEPEKLKDLALFLNSPQGAHIDELYFSRDGQYHFNFFEYKGNKYSRFIKRNKFDNNNELVQTIVELVPGTEIIKIIEANEIIKMYYDWKNNNKEEIISEKITVKKVK